VSLSAKAREMSAALHEGLGRESASGESSGTPHKSKTGGIEAAKAVECQTCKSRRYKDDSNDPSVSFQTATRIAPGAEESAVRAHEQEHVSHEQTKARESGGRVVSQNVSIHYQICPECGRMYVSGGTTTTVTRSCGGEGGESGASMKNSRKDIDAWA
jgi:ribosomal protein L32